jgi:hypothetical protein
VKSAASLEKIICRLSAQNGPPRPPISKDPFELILFENIGYLVTAMRPNFIASE